MLKKTLRSILTLTAAVAVMTLAAGRAMADKLHLKDGRVLDGTVLRQENGNVWFKAKIGGVESSDFYPASQVTKVETDATPTPDTKAPAKSAGDAGTPAASAPAAGKEEPKARTAGVPRAAVISLGGADHQDMVGVFFTAEQLKRLIPELQKDKIDVVVFRVRSGGGLALELQPLSDVIHNEYKPKFRVVAWIESAISAAAMTSHCIEEIYMMPKGNYGGCTMFRPDGTGGGIAATGRELEEVLYQMEKISARGNHPKEIMRSMQIMEPLSCTIDENGDVHWYNNLDGQYIVNPRGQVLTFNAQDALKYKFSKGIAADYETLGKLMGYKEIEWVGKTVPGVPYPVCRAEEINRKFRETTGADQAATNRYFTLYQQAIGMAASAPPEERGKFIGKARDALESIKRMVKNNPNFAFLIFNIAPSEFKYWVEKREEELRNLAKR